MKPSVQILGCLVDCFFSTRTDTRERDTTLKPTIKVRVPEGLHDTTTTNVRSRDTEQQNTIHPAVREGRMIRHRMSLNKNCTQNRHRMSINKNRHKMSLNRKYTLKRKHRR